MTDNYSSALTYLSKLPDAIANSGGDKATRRAAMVCRRFGLSESETWDAMIWFNANKCQPAWSEKDLRHKMSGLSSVSVTKPLGQSHQMSARRIPRFVAPVPARSNFPDTRPICQRSAQEEELWWARVAISLGTTLEEFDQRCGNT